MTAQSDSGPGAEQRLDPLKEAIQNFLAFRVNAGQTSEVARRELGKWILLGNAPPQEIRSELESLSARLDLKALGSGPILVSLDLVQPEDVEWIVENWIPRGKATLLSGDPKLGKSLVSLSYIAACSRGRRWPDPNGVPTQLCSSIILSAEDGVADTILRRLQAMDADLSKIKVLTGVRAQIGGKGELIEQPFSAEEHIAHLEMAIEELGDVGIILFDPITAFGGSTDTNLNHEVRRILDRLQRLAAQKRIALVLITHLNKSAGSKAIYRSMGSLAYTAVCRMLLTLAKDKKNPSRRLLLRDGNLLPNQMPGYAFTVTSEPGTNVGKLVWEPGMINMTADEALREDGDADRRETLLDRAIAWLRDRLSEGPVETNIVTAESVAADITAKTLERARKELGVIARRRDSKWFMQLPGEDDSSPDPGKGAPAGGHDGDGGIGGVDGLGVQTQEKKEEEKKKGEGEGEDRQERQGRQPRQPEEPGGLDGRVGGNDEGRQDRQGRHSGGLEDGDPTANADGDVEPVASPGARRSQASMFEEPRAFHDDGSEVSHRG